MFLAQLLGWNKFLLFRQILPYKYALKVQSWLLQVWALEQKQLCRVTFRVLERSFAEGEIPLDEDTLQYFKDLKSLEAEGRYNIVLHLLYIPRNKSLEDDDKCTMDSN
ncbi:hypothetical protein [Leptolyngbya sp. PL-A3]|uniref:hypothetical protein n=1 Tax=Leptolyngbya sp. PL-A3 TaxID=2933911 RepID=UPI003298F340